MDAAAEFLKSISLTPTEKTHFLVLEGVGVNKEEVCVKSPKVLHTLGTFKYINYGSIFILKDIWNLFKDMKSIATGTALRRPSRLTHVVNVIQQSLISDTDLVVLIGCSHGSIIMHAAILRLKIELSDYSLLRKLRFITLGSPQFPNPYLLRQFEMEGRRHLINYYHENDKHLQLLTILPGKARNPLTRQDGIVPYVLSDYGSLFSYNPDMRIVLHKANFLGFKNLHCRFPKFQNVFYHVSPFLAYPSFLLDQYTKQYETLEMDINTAFSRFLANVHSYTNCNAFFLSGTIMYVLLYLPWSKNNRELYPPCEQEGGRGIKQRIRIISTNKTYVVRIEQQSKKKYILSQGQRVYLKDIKGKYRIDKKH